MILVDSNIPMYLVGATHAHKADAQRLLERCITERERLVTDAEVLQRSCTAMSRSTAETRSSPPSTPSSVWSTRCSRSSLAIVERAKAIVLGKRQLSARDALHVAVMERHGIARILSFDAGFDGVPGIHRLR